ncbi:hypothetical protein OG340_20695 [Streptomyces virginiae]|nr:hypothetical protein [Streptomyces virginiae]
MAVGVAARTPPRPYVQPRSALTAHGITLPSLDLHLRSYAGRYDSPPLITLGNCSAATAQRLADVLRAAR